jgi:hypothetical protein
MLGLRMSLLWAIAFIVMTGAFSGPVAVADDTQYWNEFILEAPLSQQVVLEVGCEQQLVDDVSEFAVYNITLEPSCEFRDWMSFGLGYRWEREKEESEWATENRYWLHQSFMGALAGFECRLKTKLELRELEDNEVWRIRSRLKLQYPAKVGSLELAPFISEEPFYDFDAEAWNRNRAMVGLSVGVSQHVELSLYCLNLAEEDEDEWTTAHVVGTELVFAF